MLSSPPKGLTERKNMNSLMTIPLLKNIRTFFTTTTFPTPLHSRSVLMVDQEIRQLQQNFSHEIKAYLNEHPQTKHVDIYLNDTHGTFSGKRVAVENLFSLSSGCYFPQSVYAMDREGKIITSSPDRLINEEPDNVCLPVSGTLRPSAHDPRHNAQLLLTMLDSNNMPWPLEPRVILQNVLRQFHQHGLYPVVAAEMEFYLVDPAAQQNRPQGCFHLAVPSAYSAFIEELESMAAAQRLPLSGIVSEAEAGQFELNMCHSHNVVDSCEQVLALRKLTGTVAGKFGYQANFMAKPFSELAGNGLHFHVSLNDANGDNVFASPAEAPNEMVRLSLAGMLELMPASLAIMAPGVNGFRRLRKNLDEPLFHSWGYNKRNAALRIPCSDARNRRIEYRLAGADANPYLVMATLLTGMLYGLERIDDEALANFTHASPDLPLFQQPALEAFRQCAYLADHLGSAFCDQWYHGKLAELNAFERIVTAEELS